jgi:hypothetical protein
MVPWVKYAANANNDKGFRAASKKMVFFFVEAQYNPINSVTDNVFLKRAAFFLPIQKVNIKKMPDESSSGTIYKNKNEVILLKQRFFPVNKTAAHQVIALINHCALARRHTRYRLMKNNIQFVIHGIDG